MTALTETEQPALFELPDPADAFTVGLRVKAAQGESLVPVGTPGMVVLAAGDGASWPTVRYDGRADPVLTDPRWITPAPHMPSALWLLGDLLAGRQADT